MSKKEKVVIEYLACDQTSVINQISQELQKVAEEIKNIYQKRGFEYAVDFIQDNIKIDLPEGFDIWIDGYYRSISIVRRNLRAFEKAVVKVSYAFEDLKKAKKAILE